MEYLQVADITDSHENIISESLSAQAKWTKPQVKRSRLYKSSRRTFDNDFLDALSAGVQRTLQPSLRQVNLSREQFLYHQEDQLNFIYFPVTAVISEFKMLDDGRMVEISVTGKEGYVGLSSVYSSSDRVSNCVQVSQPGVALRLDASILGKLLLSNEKLRKSLNHYMAVYIRQVSQKVICNVFHSVKQRLCTWILMLQDRAGSRSLSLTHEQIARTLGVYRPTVTCIAQELREDNLITYSRAGISIFDRMRVEQAACSCYGELRYSAAGLFEMKPSSM